MKHDWEYKKLREICLKITDGSHNPPKGIERSEFLMISSQNVYDDRIDVSDVRFLSKEDFNIENKRTQIKCGDVLLTIVGTIGRCAVVDENINHITLQRSVAVLSPSDNITPRFLMYCLRGNNNQLISESHGIAQKGIYLKQLSSVSIPIPPLHIQEQIVSELDKVSEIIEKKKQQVKELDNLAQSIFYDMFGDPVENEKEWEVKKIAEVAPLSEYKGGHPQIEGKYWLLNLDKVEAQTGRILDLDYFELEEIGTSVISFDKTNVLYSKLRPYLNKVVIPNGIGYATSELVPLKPQKDILDRYYLAYMLRSNAFVSFINIKVAGAKMPRVSMGTFRDFPVPLPPLDLQQSFANKIEAIEKQKELINQSIKESQTLFDARMDYYFGE